MKFRIKFLFLLLLGITQASVVYPPDGSLQVYTDTPTHGLTISVNGNVGIGTIDPSTKLEVLGTVSANAFAGNGAQLTSVSWTSLTGVPQMVTPGMVVGTANYASTSNYAVSANYATNAGDTILLNGQPSTYYAAAGTYIVTNNYWLNVSVNGVISANAFIGNGSQLTSVSWTSLTGVPVMVTPGMVVGTANYASTSNYAATSNYAVTSSISLTSNIAISMNARGLMGAITVSINNHVGIGTAIPSTKLEVLGTVSANAFLGDGSLLTGIVIAGTITNNYNGGVSINGTLSANEFVGNGTGLIGTATGLTVATASVAIDLISAVTINASSATLALSDKVVLSNASGGNIVLTLPSVSSSTGRVFRVIKTDSSMNTITISGDGNISGESSFVLRRQFGSVSLLSEGAIWIVVESE